MKRLIKKLLGIKELSQCAGCNGSGIRTCGKCGGLEKLYEEQPVHIIAEY